ncbi:hypothetical protein HanIR_Chr02g0069941 [Helianthus annuus]|nr:hypothetical protein HanIR_Chr02g0069941 [Helianthus annuus]
MQQARVPVQGCNSSVQRSILYSMVWFLWKARNNYIFRNQRSSIEWLIEDCYAQLVAWISNTSKHTSICWRKWCRSPVSCFSQVFAL